MSACSECLNCDGFISLADFCEYADGWNEPHPDWDSECPPLTDEELETIGYERVHRDTFVACAKSDWCERYGHWLVDESSAGPDSGNMDHSCCMCDKFWSIPLY